MIIQDCLARGNPPLGCIANDLRWPTNGSRIFTKIAREQIATLRKCCTTDICAGL
jgi:hypothetical protein